MDERTGRHPVQERGRRRREGFLDAAARLLERDGWDAFTTNAVAREANASIGALYDYFPSREVLVAGLFDRYEARLSEAMDTALARASEDWEQAADAAVDVLARFWADEPGYRAAWLGTQLGELRATTGSRWSDHFTEQIAVLLGAIGFGDDRHLVARTAVHLVSGLLLVAVTSTDRDRLVAETRFVLRSYLAARLGRSA